MKRKIFLVVTFFALLAVPSHSQAQFWKNVGKALKEAAVGLLYGAVDNMVANSGDQQTIDNWQSIRSDIAPTYSYGSEAGNQLAHGNVTGAIISGISATAVAAGVDEDLVALGNSGVNNLVNGQTNAAIIDATQMVAHTTGNYQFDQFFDFQRDINQINRERRENIQKGMSVEDANRIRNDRIANVTIDIAEYIQNVAADKKARVLARKREVSDALIQRGYSQTEADYLSSYMSIEDLENDYHSWSSVDEMLDYHHVEYKESPNGNIFFDDPNITQEPTPIIEEEPTNIVEEPTPEPVINEHDTALALIQNIVLDGYSIDVTELSDEQKNTLDQVAEKMLQFEDISIIILGHTCNIGSLQTNQIIGKRRAQVAKDYLTEKGIAENRIQVESRNYSEPVTDNDSQEHRKQNRRITFTINQ